VDLPAQAPAAAGDLRADVAGHGFQSGRRVRVQRQARQPGPVHRSL